MGVFLKSEDLKARSRIEEIREMDTEDIEDLLIRPVEAMLEEAFRLELNTDGDPQFWVGRFDTEPGGQRLRERFQGDMKSAVMLCCDRIESNPHQFRSQGVRGSTVAFGGGRIPTEVQSLLNRWSQGGAKTGRVFRA